MSYMEHLTIALLSSLATVGMAWTVYWWMFGRKRDATPLQHAQGWADIQRICTQLVRDSDVERAMVLMLTNGGGTPRIGAKLYVSALVNVTQDVPSHRIPVYKQLEVDMPYIEMLLEAANRGKSMQLTEVMERGLLRDLYREEGVKFSEVWHLTQTDGAYFFASFSTYTDTHLVGAQADMRIAASEIKRVLAGVYREVKKK